MSNKKKQWKVANIPKKVENEINCMWSKLQKDSKLTLLEKKNKLISSILEKFSSEYSITSRTANKVCVKLYPNLADNEISVSG